MGKKMIGTKVDEEILRRFKIACVIQGENMNNVLEKLMQHYIDEHSNEEWNK